MLILLCGPWVLDPLAIYGGTIARVGGRIWPGNSTIDPNVGITSYALGASAAKKIFSLELPLWNHWEGFGQPLLGEAQSAAWFPLTLLLLFPAGQVVAHGILQIVGGLGFYALARELRFGTRTAFVVAAAFEFSSLFVWLKNAMINPIPFLVWLPVYVLRLIRSSPSDFPRLEIVGLGLAAGFAVLGGFPETVLIFSFFLLAWMVFYFVTEGQGWMVAPLLLTRMVLAGIVALLVASPFLMALGVFAQEAFFGSHGDGGLSAGFLGNHALLKYLFPYVSGPIFGYPVQDEIGSIGGYAGIALTDLAVVGIFAPGRWKERLFWATAAFLCIAVSHGVSPLHQWAMRIPLLNITAFYRQANIVWLMAMFLLAAHALESWDKISARRAFLIAVALGGTTLAAIGVNLGWLRELVALTPVRSWALASAAVGALAGIFLLSAWRRRRPGLAGAVLVGECVFLFLVPTLSRPRHADVDREFIAFLQDNLGFSRTVNYLHSPITPNFGSFLGIAQINFDDIPIPLRTVEFIATHLDPFYPKAYLFLPDFPMDADHSSRGQYLLDHADAYAAVGIRYILAPPRSVGLRNAFDDQDKAPHAIADGEQVSLRVSFPGASTMEGDLGIVFANYGGNTDGDVEFRICREGGSCNTRRVSAAAIEDNVVHSLISDLAVDATTVLDITIRKIGGSEPLAIWLAPPSETKPKQIAISQVRDAQAGEISGVPEVVFTPRQMRNLTLVHRSFGGDIYEIGSVKPYLTGPNCAVTVRSYDQASVDCKSPSVLTRLETWQSGWKAIVNGAPTAVQPAGLFQQVAVPSGVSVVSFDYNPWGLRYVCWVSLVSAMLFASIYLRDSARN